MRTALKNLLEQAKRHSRQVFVNTLEDGRVEVVWLRPYTSYLSAVVSAVTSSAADGLARMIAVEDARVLRHLHGEDCDCEDCCIARVDLSRTEKT